MTTSATNFHEPVEASDDVAVALSAGQDRVNAFYALGRKTRIDLLSADDLLTWDGSAERVIVADIDGLDLPDTVVHDMAA